MDVLGRKKEEPGRVESSCTCANRRERRESREARAEPLRRLAEHVLGYPAQAGNTIELLDDYQAVVDAMVADINKAETSCHLCFYIWHEGSRTADVVDALTRSVAGARGVGPVIMPG